MEDAMPEQMEKIPGLCQGERDRLARSTTHLANTRTYLAWVRTSLAVMAFGFVLERVDLFLLMAPGENIKLESVAKLKMISQFCFAAGVIILLLAAARTRAIALRIGSDGTRYRGLAETVIVLAVVALAVFLSMSGQSLLTR